MLSEHELTENVRTLYPKSRLIEEEITAMYNRLVFPGVGPTGVTGDNELYWTIQHLRVAANLLEVMGKKKGLI